MLFVSTVAFAQDEPAFDAGSCGRVQASTDLAGGGGDAVNVASHAPRLEQGAEWWVNSRRAILPE